MVRRSQRPESLCGHGVKEALDVPDARRNGIDHLQRVARIAEKDVLVSQHVRRHLDLFRRSQALCLGKSLPIHLGPILGATETVENSREEAE
jgi:hypothetical protein